VNSNANLGTPLMADPMIALYKLQKMIKAGDSVDPRSLDEGYAKLYDEPNGGQRYSYAKVIDGEVQAVSIFGLAGPIDGVTCFSVGYAVNENHRGRGLAVEAVNKGLKELTEKFTRTNMRSFFIEAVIDKTNTHSIKVAEELFPGPGVATKDHCTGTPALYFKKLIVILKKADI
jgi:RimJ/RimL family protein N-acetyltransferase